MLGKRCEHCIQDTIWGLYLIGEIHWEAQLFTCSYPFSWSSQDQCRILLPITPFPPKAAATQGATSQPSTFHHGRRRPSDLLLSWAWDIVNVEIHCLQIGADNLFSCDAVGICNNSILMNDFRIQGRICGFHHGNIHDRLHKAVEEPCQRPVEREKSRQFL